ncbi:PQQ-dependent sugar dehydrogenase [Candidatus Woesearchaeota archaeon]|nr:PQQ-dependent sugar dehydrogenase [Candidatus Woesearchaeota archaeon]
MRSLFQCAVLAMLLSACTPEGVETLVTGLDTPWAMDFLPDGRLLFTERPGRVSLLDNGVVTLVGTINVSETSESGLMGMAVDPDFDTNKYVYVMYTTGTGNRLSRFALSDVLGNGTILLDRIPSARFHDGGRLKFGPDGKLYLTTGDATVPSTAQSLESLAGKILRLNKDGTMPEDNYQGYIWSYGHRNPQGLAWMDGQLYATEHGPSQHDEINLITKGGNYGWPAQCGEQPNGTIEPLRCYTEFTLAPAGVAAVNNTLYIAGLRGAQVRKVVLQEGKILSEEEFITGMGRIRDVVAHDGYLYIATSNWDGRGVPRQGDDRIVRAKV